MLTLDATGRPQNIRYVVAAEWVGLSLATSDAGVDVRFVAGGLAHAWDSAERVVVCGAASVPREVFAADFRTDPWALRCGECTARVDRAAA